MKEEIYEFKDVFAGYFMGGAVATGLLTTISAQPFSHSVMLFGMLIVLLVAEKTWFKEGEQHD